MTVEITGPLNVYLTVGNLLAISNQALYLVHKLFHSAVFFQVVDISYDFISFLNFIHSLRCRITLPLNQRVWLLAQYLTQVLKSWLTGYLMYLTKDRCSQENSVVKTRLYLRIQSSIQNYLKGEKSEISFGPGVLLSPPIFSVPPKKNYARIFLGVYWQRDIFIINWTHFHSKSHH